MTTEQANNVLANKTIEESPMILLGFGKKNGVVTGVFYDLTRRAVQEANNFLAFNRNSEQFTQQMYNVTHLDVQTGVADADISRTRLQEVLDGKVTNFIYVIDVAKVTDSLTNYRVVYLRYDKVNNRYDVDLKNFTQDNLIMLGDSESTHRLLNVKLVKKGDAYIIQGIQKPINMRKLAKVQKTEEYKELHRDELYTLIETYQERGYSLTAGAYQRRRKEGIDAVLHTIFSNYPNLYEWYKENPTSERVAQILDIYFAEKNQTKAQATPVFRDNCLGIQKSNLIAIYSPTTTGVKVIDLPDLSSLTGAEKIVLTVSKEGLISVAPTRAIQDLSALVGGVESGELQVRQLQGVMNYGIDNAPVSDKAKTIIKERDRKTMQYLINSLLK